MPKSTLKIAIVLVACIAMLGACTGARLPTKVAARDRTSTTLDGSDTTLNGTTATTDAFAPDGTPIPKVGAPGTGGGPVTTRPKSPSARSTLFNAKEDTVGITEDIDHMCAHAALTYGAAFNTSDATTSTCFWRRSTTRAASSAARSRSPTRTTTTAPTPPFTAATACKAKNPFFMLGGIGFDQIPAVRNWAEANRDALPAPHRDGRRAPPNQRFSFTGLPSTEKMGEMFGELVAARYRDKKIGIIRRATARTGSRASRRSRRVAAKYGHQHRRRARRAEQPGQLHPGTARHERRRRVVFGWENALAARRRSSSRPRPRSSTRRGCCSRSTSRARRSNTDALEPQAGRRSRCTPPTATATTRARSRRTPTT